MNNLKIDDSIFWVTSNLNHDEALAIQKLNPVLIQGIIEKEKHGGKKRLCARIHVYSEIVYNYYENGHLRKNGVKGIDNKLIMSEYYPGTLTDIEFKYYTPRQYNQALEWIKSKIREAQERRRRNREKYNEIMIDKVEWMGDKRIQNIVIYDNNEDQDIKQGEQNDTSK